MVTIDVIGRRARWLGAALVCLWLLALLASAPAQAQEAAVDGHSVALVGYGGGEFRQVGSGQWRETGADGNGFAFRETGRDAGSVYLLDDARQVRIQLDLQRGQVLYGGADGGELQPLYAIVSVQGGPPVAAPAAPRARDTSNKEFCWRDSVPRGAGTIPPTCGPGRERIGALCYSQCPAGSMRVGFDCHSTCPDGLRDDGLFCRAAEYGRGAGYPIHFGEITGEGMQQRCEADHGRGQCELSGLIQYPKCKAGYEAVGCCICRPKVPDCPALGLNPGIDLACAKKVGIGDPVVGTCPAGQEENGGLCYRRCEGGLAGVGPVCWAGAPKNWVECGMGAAKDATTCAVVVVGQVQSVGQLAFNIATLGTGTAGSGAASTAAKASRIADLKRRYQQLKKLYEAAKPAIDAAMLAQAAHGAATDAVELMDEEVVTEADILRISAQIAGLVDPSGVADTVAAYSYPKCSAYGFEP